MVKNRIQPEQIEALESSSCRCTTTLFRQEMDTNRCVFRILLKSKAFAKNIPLKYTVHSPDLELKKRGTERTRTNLTVCGSTFAEMINLQESGLP